jgi:hypothetical protein
VAFRAPPGINRQQNVPPIVAVEFEDYALLKVFARTGHGFAPVPTVLQDYFRRVCGLALLAPATGGESQIKHRAVAAIVERGLRIFAYLGSGPRAAC